MYTLGIYYNIIDTSYNDAKCLDCVPDCVTQHIVVKKR